MCVLMHYYTWKQDYCTMREMSLVKMLREMIDYRAVSCCEASACSVPLYENIALLIGRTIFFTLVPMYKTI